MKRIFAILILLSSFFLLPSALPQGSLTPPPGAPAPTMKTLAQIEPRTPISSLPFTISNSGSYYLTKNLSVTSGDAITISTSGVTLDLNGFTISSSANPAGGTGVLLGSAIKDVTILNGHIRGNVTYSNDGSYSGTGFSNGISWAQQPASNVRVSGVSVSGCLLAGISIFPASTIVDHCSVRDVGGEGIVASTVSHSEVHQSGATGIDARVASDCSAYCTAEATGLYALVTAQNCTGTSRGTGLYASDVSNCTGFGNSGPGVYGLTVNNCYGASTNGPGILASSVVNSYGRSTSDFGVTAEIVDGCFGTSDTAYGVQALKMANNSFGVSSSSFGLWATVGHMCWGYSSSAAYTSIAYKYNSP